MVITDCEKQMVKAIIPQGNNRSVLITRPQPAAQVTGQLLQAAGYQAQILPLSKTLALPVHIEEGHDGDLAAITVTSVNALRHCPHDILQRYHHLPLFAVGVRTAEAAKAAGFQTVIEGGGDAVRLAATMARELPEASHIIYLAGKVRQPVFENEVSTAGLVMRTYDVYDTVFMADHDFNNPPYGTSRKALDLVLLYSGSAATALSELQPHLPVNFFNQETKFLCISRRVAQLLPPDWQKQSLAADHPDEEGIFRLLAQL